MALPTVTINIKESPDDEPGPITYYGGPLDENKVKLTKAEFPLNSGLWKFTHVASTRILFTVEKVQSGSTNVPDITDIKPKNGEPVKSYSVWYWKYDQSMNNPLFIEIYNKDDTYDYRETKGGGSWNPHDSGSQSTRRLEGRSLEQKLDNLNCKHYKLVNIDLTRNRYRTGNKYCCDKHDTGKKRVTVKGDKIRVSLPGAKEIPYFKHHIGGESELAGIKYNEDGQSSGRRNITLSDHPFPIKGPLTVYVFYCNGSDPKLIYVKEGSPVVNKWFKKGNTGGYTWTETLEGLRNTMPDNIKGCGDGNFDQLVKELKDFGCGYSTCPQQQPPPPPLLYLAVLVLLHLALLLDLQTLCWRPLGIRLQDVVDFFNGALMTMSTSIDINGPMPVMKTEIFNQEQGYCFLEFTTAEYADLCYKLDGIQCNGYSLKLRRPIDFSSSMSSEDTKIFVQNIPESFSEEDIRKLLEAHGKLKTCNLVIDPFTRLNKGYGFFEYESSSSAKEAVIHLNGHVIQNNVLSVKHAAFSSFAAGGKPADCRASSIITSVSHCVFSNPLLGLQMQNGRKKGSEPSRVVQLLNVVYPEDILDDKNYREMLKEIKEEAQKYGPLEEIYIPRIHKREEPASIEDVKTEGNDKVAVKSEETSVKTDVRQQTIEDRNKEYQLGVGKVFLKYSNETAGRKAQYMLNGRIFDKNRVVCAAFFPCDLYQQGKYTLL
ncbi:hypothetical protein BEWA_001250 [Theileria equi strain WA]|uniref:RRM domain-containing protein n=1 Tax=Theileria equi strain WA TaxID=1537102 RepID=L0AZN0_THEEQ|nr:hypothetical protein BEWA_001250 [Theileria equi strain WA]AFZ80718.1 hypothetical protein BEWA_001250 [Theileria equi strain WA]|eukprot:XP_004830384.1 hypothetical protein BEWA_001250 [Theileria equi strain WA]